MGSSIIIGSWLLARIVLTSATANTDQYTDIFSDIKFTELRWDEKEKHIKKINTTSPQIWSSATLYDTDAIQKREELFENWIKEHSLPENKDILNFHNKKHGLQESIDIIMKRENELMTLSISQLIVKHQALEYIYLDLIENKEYFLKIPE